MKVCHLPMHLHIRGIGDNLKITLPNSFHYFSFNLILFRMLHSSMTKNIVMFIISVLLVLCSTHVYVTMTTNQHQELKCENSPDERKSTMGNLNNGKKRYHCQILKYANPSLPVTALASFPGSGNTWVRHLLQEAAGI